MNTHQTRRTRIAPIALAAVALIGLAGCSSEDAPETTSAATTTSAAPYTLSPERIEANRLAAERAAEYEKQQREAKEAAAAAAAEKARLANDRSTYETVGERDYALIVKNPDANTGRKLVVHGVVTQFDSGTGTTAFRADTGNAPSSRKYDFDENTIVTGPPAELAKVVKDDILTMYVEVTGSMTYDTSIGGSTTVPKYYANMIDVVG